MAQNFSKNEYEYQDNAKTVTLKNYLDYSNTADMLAMQVNDLDVHNSYNHDIKTLSFEFLSTDIANRIEDELAKFWTSKQTIRSIVKEINKQNAYSFLKNMLTISDSRTVLGDIKNYISYYELKHILQSVLAAAEDIGLSDCSKFKLLLKEYNNVNVICSKNPNKGIDKKLLDTVNSRIERLFEEMSKVAH